MRARITVVPGLVASTAPPKRRVLDVRKGQGRRRTSVDVQYAELLRNRGGDEHLAGPRHQVRIVE